MGNFMKEYPEMLKTKSGDLYVAFFERDDLYDYGYTCQIFTDEKLINIIRSFHLNNVPSSSITKQWEEYSEEYFEENNEAVLIRDRDRWRDYCFEKDFFFEKNKIIYLTNFLTKYIRRTYPLYSIDMLISKNIVENFEMDCTGGTYLINPAIWRLSRSMRLEELINKSENPEMNLEDLFGKKIEESELEEYGIFYTY